MLRRIALIGATPSAWMRSLWNARVLLDGQWSRYMGFRPSNALNSLFYRTQWLNIDRYGRNGVSKVVGLGDYPLARWLHISSLSSYMYAQAGAVTMLGGTIIWAATHLIWIEAGRTLWVVLNTVVVLMSTTAYAMAFVRQNYNILGWLWLPVGLFGLLTAHWVIAAFAFLAASLASITVIVAAAPLVIAMALTTGQVEPALALLPAVMKCGLHFWPVLGRGEVANSIASLARAIGLSRARSRYKRRSMRFGVFNSYFSLLYLAGSAALWWLQGGPPVLPLVASVLFVANQRFVRFADEQSVIILAVSAFAAHTLSMPPGMPELAILFVVSNPVPLLLGITAGKHELATYAPFDHTRIELGCDRLLAPVPEGSRVLCAFNDPKGIYEDIFDGYRIAMEPLFFVAARRGIHMFPDWYAVAETNYPAAPEFWGRTVENTRENVRRWRADLVLCYRESGTELPEEWLEHFESVGEFDWADYLDLVSGAEPWRSTAPCPAFSLLKVRDWGNYDMARDDPRDRL